MSDKYKTDSEDAQKKCAKEGLKEIKVALDEMRLAGFDVLYGDKLPDWVHPGTVAGFRRLLDDGQKDVRWIYKFHKVQGRAAASFCAPEGYTGWSVGDPTEPLGMDECLDKISKWLKTGVWNEEEQETD